MAYVSQSINEVIRNNSNGLLAETHIRDAIQQIEAARERPIRLVAYPDLPSAMRRNRFDPEAVDRVMNYRWTNEQRRAFTGDDAPEWFSSDDAAGDEWWQENGITVLLNNRTFEFQETFDYGLSFHQRYVLDGVTYRLGRHSVYEQLSPPNAEVEASLATVPWVMGYVDPDDLPDNITREEAEARIAGHLSNGSNTRARGGIFAGELLPNTVMLATTYLFGNTYNEFDFVAIFDEAIEQSLSISRDSLEEARRERERAALQAVVENIAERQGRGHIDALRAEMETLQRNVNTSEDRLRNAMNGLEAKSVEYRAATTRLIPREEAIEKVNAAIEQIEANDKVVELRAEGNALIVKTCELTLTCPDTEREATLGEMKLKIPFSGTETLNITNLTNRKGSWDHPHVDSGRPCFGNMNRTFDDLIRRLDIGGLVAMLIVMLETFNPEDSWGFNANLWYPSDDPVVEERA